MSQEIENGIKAVEVPLLAEILSKSIENLGYPVGLGMRPSQRHALEAAGKLFDRFSGIAKALRDDAIEQPDVGTLRSLLIQCRGSVKLDLNNYERMLIREGDEQRRAILDAECERLQSLIDQIDAEALKATGS